MAVRQMEVFIFLTPVLSSHEVKNYAVHCKRYKKNQAGMNLNHPPLSQNCRAVRTVLIRSIVLKARWQTVYGITSSKMATRVE